MAAPVAEPAPVAVAEPSLAASGGIGVLPILLGLAAAAGAAALIFGGGDDDDEIEVEQPTTLV